MSAVTSGLETIVMVCSNNQPIVYVSKQSNCGMQKTLQGYVQHLYTGLPREIWGPGAKRASGALYN